MILAGGLRIRRQSQNTLYFISELRYGAITIVKSAEPLMEVDTGATKSIISLPPFKILGEVSVTVAMNNQEEQLSLLVVEGDGPSLLDKTIKLDWAHLHQMLLQILAMWTCFPQF